MVTLLRYSFFGRDSFLFVFRVLLFLHFHRLKMRNFRNQKEQVFGSEFIPFPLLDQFSLSFLAILSAALHIPKSGRAMIHWKFSPNPILEELACRILQHPEDASMVYLVTRRKNLPAPWVAANTPWPAAEQAGLSASCQGHQPACPLFDSIASFSRTPLSRPNSQSTGPVAVNLVR